jgi:Meckel syndrome type 1 protein
MPTDTDKPLNGTPEPFRRPVVWGRPPATVFRVGALPRSGVPSSLPRPRPMQLSPGFLSGSLIPDAARTDPQARTRTPVPSVTRAPGPGEGPTAGPTAAAASPGLTAGPVPVVEPEAGNLQEPVRSTVPAQPGAVTAGPVRRAGPAADAGPKPVNPFLLYAGTALAALTVLALGGWLLTRPPADRPVVDPGAATELTSRTATRPQPVE